METACVVINLQKDNEIIKCLKDEKDAADDEDTAIQKMKEEVNIQQIKEHRSPIAIYNPLKMFIIICTKEIFSS